MKILVVEDRQDQREAAEQQLAGHEITFKNNLMDFFPFKLFWSDSERKDFSLAEYDMVLTDVNIPSPVDQGPMVIEGPTGLLVALKAIQSGVKYLGVISEISHHAIDPVAKGLDMWIFSEKAFETGKTKVFIEGYNACEDTYPVKNWKRVYDILTT